MRKRCMICSYGKPKQRHEGIMKPSLICSSVRTLKQNITNGLKGLSFWRNPRTKHPEGFVDLLFLENEQQGRFSDLNLCGNPIDLAISFLKGTSLRSSISYYV